MDADGLFIYGTLRNGGVNHGWLMRTQPAGTCHAWAPGRLWHLPDEGYPAMVAGPVPEEPPPGTGWVSGEFVGWEDLEAMEAALPDLDALEDVPGGLFERCILPVHLDNGQTYAAWTYVFPADRVATLERQAVELTEGDWGPYL